MDADELLRETRRQAVLESLAPEDAGKALERYRGLLESGVGSLNEWDERFLTFIREHSDGILLGGTAGEDIHFIFSPPARAGFWVVARPELRGKGFFLQSDIERLIALAQEKRLLPG
jgi:hypothetical protein